MDKNNDTNGIIDRELVTVLEHSGLERTQAETVLEGFKDFFQEVKEFENEAKAILITEPTQVDEMKRARELRLKLKDIRVNAEKVRKERKEFFLRGGKAIDGIANVLKALIIPLEEHLDKQENYVERIEEENKERVNQERIARLAPYVVDINVYNLKDMTDDAFEILFNTSKVAWEAQREADKKAVEMREAQAKADKEEQERIRKENEELRKQKEESEKKERGEREAREKAEAELKAKKDAEEREEREKVEAEKKAKQEKRKLEKQEEYRKFRAEHGWTEDTKTDFKEENTGDAIVLWKKLGEFKFKE